jgi:hypothetical protein
MARQEGKAVKQQEVRSAGVSCLAHFSYIEETECVSETLCRLHDVTFQNTVFFIFIAVRT